MRHMLFLLHLLMSSLLTRGTPRAMKHTQCQPQPLPLLMRSTPRAMRHMLFLLHLLMSSLLTRSTPRAMRHIRSQPQLLLLFMNYLPMRSTPRAMRHTQCQPQPLPLLMRSTLRAMRHMLFQLMRSTPREDMWHTRLLSSPLLMRSTLPLVDIRLLVQPMRPLPTWQTYLATKLAFSCLHSFLY
ncbi:hypothetical protein BX070DRAFT_220941 [Coemansia spiralis]|nr:hypothetical protein BX070DRAFT_220941 [Coemansia spiralis]